MVVGMLAVPGVAGVVVAVEELVVGGAVALAGVVVAAGVVALGRTLADAGSGKVGVEAV